MSQQEETYPILQESTQKGDEWVHKCGTTLLCQVVIHSIHDGPFPLSGSGQVYREEVPYCPACQDQPSSIGRPLRQDPVEAREIETLRRMRNNGRF